MEPPLTIDAPTSVATDSPVSLSDVASTGDPTSASGPAQEAGNDEGGAQGAGADKMSFYFDTIPVERRVLEEVSKIMKFAHGKGLFSIFKPEEAMRLLSVVVHVDNLLQH